MNDDSGSRSTRFRVVDFFVDLSPFERLLVTTMSIVAGLSGAFLLYSANETVLVETPKDGGLFIEGITGTPRFINPLLAMSDADRDLTELVYAGLMTRDAGGALIPELASGYEVSEDGLTYTFTLRDNVVFHDGTPLTSADVVYTILTAANPDLHSLTSVFANWKNAVVEALDEKTVRFTLPEPYVPFLENTTLGILPKHIWGGVNPDEYHFSSYNSTPVGAGPYRIRDVVRDKSGIPASYALTASETYVLGTPHIKDVQFRLFDSKTEALNAFKTGDIHAVGGVPYAEVATMLESPTKTPFAVRRIPLLRTFAIFLNHNKQPLLLRDEVRSALTLATPKEAIIAEVLHGYGTILSGPLPSTLLGRTGQVATSEEDVDDNVAESLPSARVLEAQDVLENAGWKKNDETGVYERKIDDSVRPLSISLTVLNLPELTAVAERVAESWRNVGIQVEVNSYEQTDTVTSVVRPRRFDTLLYGMVLGHELDPYAFWHSSQRNDPGLNIAQYADIEADALLEKARTELDSSVRFEYLQKFTALTTKQRAAIFLYMPDYVYVVRSDVGNVGLHPLAEAYERFNTIHTWYMDTDSVWPFVRDVL